MGNASSFWIPVLALLVLAAALVGLATPAKSAMVSEAEAVAVADLWLAMELNSGLLRIGEEERGQRLAGLRNRQTLYITSKDELLGSRPAKGRILAYVVKYQPTGYVVVSADDRIEPVVAFDAESQFRWDQPDRNFLRYFLGRSMLARWKHLDDQQAAGAPAAANANWTKLRKKTVGGESLSIIEFSAPAGVIYLLWDTPLWDQGWPYNTEVVAHNGGNSCPTGCTATAMAMKMRFHEWPTTGNGSHSYDDNSGTLQYSHSADFGAHTYNWASMPMGNVASANQQVADLMYHCGIVVEMDYEPGGSGAWPTTSSTNTYLRYKGTTERTSGHETPIVASVRGGLPVIISSSSHTVVVDGYRDTESPYLHMNAGWSGGSNGWYNLPDMPAVSDPTIDRSYPYSSPNNFVYVDGAWGGTENGNIQNPYDTLSEGESAVPSDGRLWAKGGTYTGAGNDPLTLDSPMRITAYEGDATVGDNLRLHQHDGDLITYADLPTIRLRTSGVLRVY